MQERDLCHKGTFKPMQRWEKCISVLGDYINKKANTSVKN
jgi:hypothetical protein